jgi:hypothetical protein
MSEELRYTQANGPREGGPPPMPEPRPDDRRAHRRVLQYPAHRLRPVRVKIMGWITIKN